MFYVDADQNRYYLKRQFSYLGVNYGASAATHAKFQELGFTQVIIQPRPDDRFYIVSGPNNDGSYNSTPRDLDQLKLNYIVQQKQTARQLLSSSDWYVIRNIENGAAIPANWESFRTAVRVAADARCNEVFGVSTVEELQQLLTDPEAMTAFPEQPDEAADTAASYDLPYEDPTQPQEQPAEENQTVEKEEEQPSNGGSGSSYSY